MDLFYETECLQLHRAGLENGNSALSKILSNTVYGYEWLVICIKCFTVLGFEDYNTEPGAVANRN